MNHIKIAKEQLLHLVFGVLFFLLIGTIAVGLDLLSDWVSTTSVSSFTSSALRSTAHAMLILDLVLFCTYLTAASMNLIKEMAK